MMRYLRPGSQTIDVSNGVANSDDVRRKPDLTTNWILNAERMEVNLPATNNVQFYRFRAITIMNGSICRSKKRAPKDALFLARTFI